MTISKSFRRASSLECGGPISQLKLSLNSTAGVFCRLDEVSGMTTLDYALRQFELATANLARLEKLWERIEGALPSGPVFGAPPEYDEWCIAFENILRELPVLDGLRVEYRLYDYDEVAQMHVDALELGEFESRLRVAKMLSEQGDELRQYRIRLEVKRRELVRSRLIELIDQVDRVLGAFGSEESGEMEPLQLATSAWKELGQSVDEINTLLGSGARSDQWSVLWQELETDRSERLPEIADRVWPDVRTFLRNGLYDDFDPIPVDADDLSEVLNAKAPGPVSMKLDWSVLNDENFERLLFDLFSEAQGYENVQWLQKTHAPDRGRDISADRVDLDVLGGVRRYRTIIQCKHWLSKSVGPGDIASSRAAMALWEPPRVDALVIATSGRFTADAVSMVERHNQGDRALSIEMWPESHLEKRLASRPHLLGEFGLRRK